MTRSPSLDEFANIYRHGFARVAACTLPTALADPLEAAQRHVEQVQECHAEGVALAVFPELSLTGYSLDDLVLQEPCTVGEQADVVGQSAESLHQRMRLVEPTGMGVRRDQPEATHQEGMLLPGQPVHSARRAVAQRQPVDQQVALHRRDGADGHVEIDRSVDRTASTVELEIASVDGSGHPHILTD